MKQFMSSVTLRSVSVTLAAAFGAITYCSSFASGQSIGSSGFDTRTDPPRADEVLKKVDQLVRQNQQLEEQNHELMDQVSAMRRLLVEQSDASQADANAHALEQAIASEF